MLFDNKEVFHGVLSFSVTDIEIPLTREWALLSIRNLCEESEEIRNYIQSLKPQEVVLEDEFLSKIKADIQLDPNTGKLLFNKKPE
jgi:Holliday junction resolvasome RuvABC endonuclease subunit